MTVEPFRPSRARRLPLLALLPLLLAAAACDRAEGPATEKELSSAAAANALLEAAEENAAALAQDEELANAAAAAEAEDANVFGSNAVAGEAGNLL